MPQIWVNHAADILPLCLSGKSNGEERSQHQGSGGKRRRDEDDDAGKFSLLPVVASSHDGLQWRASYCKISGVLTTVWLTQHACCSADVLLHNT